MPQRKSIFVENAENCGLRVREDYKTPGDGNCWYYAVIQQMRRPEIVPFIPENMQSFNHFELRREVSEYVRSIQNNCQAIIKYRRLRLSSDSYFNWQQYLRQQSTDREMAADIFLNATANSIGLDIHINSYDREQVITSYWSEPDIPQVNYRPFLLIGYHNLHFQSLIPLNDFAGGNVTNQFGPSSSSYSDAARNSNLPSTRSSPPRKVFVRDENIYCNNSTSSMANFTKVVTPTQAGEMPPTMGDDKVPSMMLKFPPMRKKFPIIIQKIDSVKKNKKFKVINQWLHQVISELVKILDTRIAKPFKILHLGPARVLRLIMYHQAVHGISTIKSIIKYLYGKGTLQS